MPRSGGRGRGIDNRPAWLKKQQEEQQGHAPANPNTNTNTNTNTNPAPMTNVRVGRGRGVDQRPAWMVKQEQEQGIASAAAPVNGRHDINPPPLSNANTNTNSNGSGSVSGGGRSGRQEYGRRSERDRDRDRDPYRSENHRDRGGKGGGGGRRGGGGGSRGGGGGSNFRSRAPLQRFVNAPNTVPSRHVSRRNATREEWQWNEDRRRRRLQRRKEQPSKFDLQPTPEAAAMELQAKAAYALKAAGTVNPSFVHPSQLSGNYSGGGNGGPVNQQTRHARRLYVGNVPEDINEAEVKQFFVECVETTTRRSWRNDDDPILSVYINRERRFAFVEFTTVEMCTSCLALDGINLAGKGIVKIKRPNDFNPALLTPNPAGMSGFDASLLGIVSSSVPDGPNKIFLGGLPYHLTDAQVLELLAAFGRVKAFHLVRDVGSATSKGYGFVEYSDPNVTDVAVMGLEGMELGGGKSLTARKASAREGGSDLDQHIPIPTPGRSMETNLMSTGTNVVGGVDVDALLNAAMGGAEPMPALSHQQPTISSASLAEAHSVSAAVDAMFANAGATGAPPPLSNGVHGDASNMSMPQGNNMYQHPSSILVLLNMVMDEDLATDETFTDLYDEVKGECEKFGRLISMKIPRPIDRYPMSAVKKIFLEYNSIQDAQNAERELAGRAFGPNVVQCAYFDESAYRNGNLS